MGDRTNIRTFRRPGQLRVTLFGDAAGVTRALVEGGPLVPPFRLDPGVVEGMARLSEQLRRLCPGAARVAELAQGLDVERLIFTQTADDEGEGA